MIRCGSYPRIPLGFIWPASRTIRSNPSGLRCSFSVIRSQISANNRKSRCFPERSGYVRKCGMIRSIRTGRLRVSHFKVLSLRSGRTLPHPKYRCNSSSTSERSPFWLTDRLGLTSHPTTSVGLGEIETVKHPSPSTHPERYDETSTSCREPAYCPSHRFATSRRYVGDVTGLEPHPEGISRYRAMPRGTSASRRGLPTALPAGYRLVLGRGSRVGLRRYERVCHTESLPCRANSLPDKEFRYLRHVVTPPIVWLDTREDGRG